MSSESAISADVAGLAAEALADALAAALGASWPCCLPQEAAPERGREAAMSKAVIRKGDLIGR
jgi:hypothetical protein